MAVLLMRHMESVKNVTNSFSSKSNEESLTDYGKKIIHRISGVVSDFIKKNDLVVDCIYCAKSLRAEMTAKILAEEIGVRTKSFEALCSNKSGALLGKSEQEAQHINPTFMKQLYLFRAGLFSSYDFIKVNERENKHDFELRVLSCIDKILLNDRGSLQIIILHHSSITATMINYARKYYNYPKNFYGHVACDLGHVYLINNNEILLCNESPERLLSVKI